MVKVLYQTYECAVPKMVKNQIRVTTGVKQGCTMSGFLFLLAIDYIMNRTTEGELTGFRWNFTTNFADDLA